MRGKKARDLTQREQEVLALLAEGYTNDEIAKILKVTTSTVATYRIRIKNRLQLTDFASLVKYALSNGFTSVDKYRSQDDIL